MARCKDCVCEKVCRYNDGFNLYCKEDYECPHYFSTADAAPRAEIAIKIFSDIEKIAKTVGFPEALVNGMIVNHILDGLYIDSQDFAELKKKYTEGKDDT